MSEHDTESPTTTQTGPRVSGDQMRDVNRLRRSTTDRYVAGVAGGLGRHFDIDPTVIRVTLAVLTLFGGAGALIYGAVWLFVPEEGQDKAPVDVTPDVRGIVLIVAGAIALSLVFGTPFLGDSWGLGFPFPLVIIGVIAVILYLTRDQWRSGAGSNVPPPPWGSAPPSATPSAQEGTTSMSVTHPGTPAGPPTSGTPGQQPPAWMPPPGPAYVPPPPKPRRTGMVLFWPTLALIAIGLGALGIIDISNPVPVPAYAALAVVITGVMLLVGAFVARPGGLIALGLAATLALVVSALASAATGDSFRDQQVLENPTTAAEVQADYGISTGDLTVDLSDVRDLDALDGRQIDAHLNAGELRVILPAGLNARVDAEIEYAGEIQVGDTTRGGVNLSLERTLTSSTAAGTPTIDLEVDARVGQIVVEQR